jgi:hypothetical protein
MAQSNQPFKRPNLSENEEYTRIPPPMGQESSFNPNTNLPKSVVPGYIPSPPVSQPSQEEINWAIQLEENVQRKGYKPTEQEMARYQDIANRITMYQQSQAVQVQQPQALVNQQQQVQFVPQKKSKIGLVFKILSLIVLAIFFWAKVSIVALEPSYFVPKGKLYFVIKPINFSTMYYSINTDKIYEEKLRKGFTSDDIIKNNSKKISKNWQYDPEYLEENYIIILPYPNFNFTPKMSK